MEELGLQLAGSQRSLKDRSCQLASREEEMEQLQVPHETTSL